MQNPAQRRTSRLTEYLPAIYADSEFLIGLLSVIDHFWVDFETQLSQLHAYVDPSLTPAKFLPWLATWVDLALDENWPEQKQRELIRQACWLFERRGTAGGLRDYLAVYLGEATDVQITNDPNKPFHFIVRLGGVPAEERDRLERIIDEEKPAHTTYSLYLS